MATNRRTSTSEVEKRTNEAQLKSRLEDEVSSLKKRLDDLRKAKNTTFLKREREVIHVSAPFGKRDAKPDTKKGTGEKAQKQVSNNSSSQEIEELRKQFAAEVDILKRQNEELSNCGHEEELELLRRRLAEVEGDNDALKVENQQLTERVESLATQLSVKEAKWCETEEKLKLEIQRSWGEKYREWMEATEAKIVELQQTNALLRGYLKGQKPKGVDPSGQDEEHD